MSIVFINGDKYFSWEKIFNEVDVAEIKSESDVSIIHIDRFRALMFGIIHEIDCHVTNDIIGDPYGEAEHQACGSDVLDPLNGLSKGHTTPYSSMNKAAQEILSLPDEVLKKIIFNGVQEYNSGNNINNDVVITPHPSKSSPLDPCK